MYYLSSDKLKEFENVVEGLMAMNNVLLLVRGVPGMGKSYLGRHIAQKFEAIQLETDQQFMTSGEYVFDVTKIEDAHNITQNETKNLLIDSAPLVVVSNTFTMKWEMSAYEELAAKYNYTFLVFDLFLEILASNPNLQHKNLSKRNQPPRNNRDMDVYLAYLTETNDHSVPAEAMRLMCDRYEFSPQVVCVEHRSRDSGAKETSFTAVYSEANSTAHVDISAPAAVSVLDTGYYLALDVTSPEDGSVFAPSPLYRQCMEACQTVIETVGVVTGEECDKICKEA